MKFIHAADIHLGCQPDRGFPWSRERSFDILAAFRDLIDACRTERADLAEAMEHLGERERKILFLRYFEGKTQTEISAEVGISQAQVSRLEKNAVNAIREEIACD